MEFSIICEDLIKILKKISNISHNIIMPITKNIFIKIKDKKLIIYSTNLITEIIIEDKISEEYISGEILISYKKILNICKVLNKKSILFFIKKNNFITIKSEKTYFSLISPSSHNFPIFKKNKFELEISISCLSLKNLIKQTQHSIGIQDTRKYINGMLFEIYRDTFKTVSTDGHRLSIYEININNILNDKFAYIVLKQGINDILKFLENFSEENIKLGFCKENIYIYTKKTLLTSKLLNEKFPNYLSIISKNMIFNIELNRTIFKNKISKVLIISNDKVCLIKLNFNKKNLIINSINSDQEKSEECIELKEFIEETIEISINGFYLLESLSILNSENIIFKFSDNKSSIYIEEYNTKNRKHVIMPICM